MHTEVNTHYYWKYRKKWKWIHLSYVRIYCFIILAKGRRKLAWTFCLLVSLTLFFRRLYKTLQSVILNNIENPKYMENLKISFLAYCLFSEFLILEDYMLTIWGVSWKLSLRPSFYLLQTKPSSVCSYLMPGVVILEF